MEKQQITLTILDVNDVSPITNGAGGSVPPVWVVDYKITIPRGNGRTEIYNKAKIGEEIELNDIYTYETQESTK